MASRARRDEVADEQGLCGETGAELQVDMDGLVVPDLVQHLTSQSRQEALVLLYHGSPCSHIPQESTSTRVDGYPCLPVCLNVARLAFEVQKTRKKGAVTKVPGAEDIDPGTTNFMQKFFNLDMLRDSCFAVGQDTSRTSKPFTALIDEEPLKRAFDKVLLYYLQLSREGYLRCFQLMWDNAPHLPIVAGVLAHKGETLLCLRLRVSSAYVYIILDAHVRPGSCHRGPTFSIHKSRESAAQFLYRRWNGCAKAEDDEDLLDDEFSLHVLLQSKQMPSEPSPFIPLPGTGEVEVKPSTPASISGPAPSQKVKRNAIRNKSSQNRLQSEFGWQMSLQDESVALSSPDNGPSSTRAPVHEQADISEGHPSTEPPQTIKTRSSRNDLYKKDIGWQLALQEQVGGIKLPLQVVDDTIVTKGHKSQKSVGQSSSATSLSLKSGSSSLMQPRTPLASSFQSEIERRKPVRADIGWQHNLEAKSMTFPIQSLYSRTTPSGSSLALASPAFKPAGFNGSSPLLATTEFGHLQDENVGRPPAAKAEGSSEEDQYDSCDFITAECDYCFGPIVVDDLLSDFGTAQCDHRLCQDCLRRYIIQELGFGNFPIPCPACMLRNRIRPTLINIELMDKLDFSDVEKDKFLSLEFQTLPVTLKCPNSKCGHSSQVSREDLLGNKQRSCNTCERSWCRDCHQTFPRDETPEALAAHVCKDKKRNSFPSRRVIRYCPGCQTSVPRMPNTNHAECPSPKCGLHFCFGCGDVIADTVRGQNPDRLVLRHYQACLQPGNANPVGDPHSRDCVIQ